MGKAMKKPQNPLLPGKSKATKTALLPAKLMPAPDLGATAAVLDRLWSVVLSRREADPSISHSARLLSRGTAKVAQKFGEEAVECLIEAVAGNHAALIGESADVLYHLLVMWVATGVRPEEVWNELTLREGMSGIAEKAARTPSPSAASLAILSKTSKIP
jgi:phosphoribosyl-ATP pyrophosphohydrolase